MAGLAIAAGIALQQSLTQTPPGAGLRSEVSVPAYAYYPDKARYTYNGWCKVAPYTTDHHPNQG